MTPKIEFKNATAVMVMESNSVAEFTMTSTSGVTLENASMIRSSVHCALSMMVPLRTTTGMCLCQQFRNVVIRCTKRAWLGSSSSAST